MRMVVLAALGLLIAAPSLPAQETAQPVGWAIKVFNKEANGNYPAGHDFGTVPKGALLQHRFPVTNIYAVPLTINCQSECGCVTVTPSLVLQPKETGSIDITMDTLKFNMPQKSVVINVKVYHPQYFSSTALTIKGFCRGDVEMTPPQASFGIIPVGQAATRELVVRYRGAMNGWQITGVAQGQTDRFDCRYQELRRMPGLVEYKVSLTLKADTPAGSLKDELSLSTNDPSNTAVLVPYDATVQALLTVLPDTVRLGTVKVGQESERMVYVRAGQPFRITAVDGQADGVTAKVSRPDAALVHVLAVKLQPTQAGPVQKSLTVRTDLGGATATIKVEATVIP
jgi:Protein of unknown function (DUF1573)